MASMIMSTFMSFFPVWTTIFVIVGLYIFFFGIYVPYDKYRQKKKKEAKNSPQKQTTQKSAPTVSDQKQRDQLKALRKAGILSEEEYQKKKRGMH
ncbi:MAG: SHOCT domain-containing protein [Oscillibacter sp.]|nr:SHOCT domain-containing protein [Oscillibacter sp.]